ncbi:hypothetical protein WG66_004247 [Moniliophthora roreri]|nr:hypothetical protein WG66_004247 [Moniliophthora roreri]
MKSALGSHSSPSSRGANPVSFHATKPSHILIFQIALAVIILVIKYKKKRRFNGAPFCKCSYTSSCHWDKQGCANRPYITARLYGARPEPDQTSLQTVDPPPPAYYNSLFGYLATMVDFTVRDHLLLEDLQGSFLHALKI